MRFETGLGLFKGPLAKAVKKLAREKLAPESTIVPSVAPSTKKPSSSVSNTRDKKPLSWSDALLSPSKVRSVIGKDDPGIAAYNKILRQLFGKLDRRQKGIFTRLFPHLDQSQQESQHPTTDPGVKMKSYIQFLTTPTADTPGTSLLLHFDDKRYLVGNIHEGVQRAGIQFGAKFTKVRDIFVTGRTEWKTTGGLLGMVLTLADSTNSASAALVEHAKTKLERERARLGRGDGNPLPMPTASEITAAKATMNIHGGPNLMHLFATARMFIFRKGVPLRVFEHDSKGQSPPAPDREPDWTDENIQVWNMAIAPSVKNTSPKSPCKRNFSQFSDPGDAARNDSMASISDDKDQEFRRNVVCEMFDSSWRMDNLEEIPLSQVSGPGSLFIRNPETKKLERYYPPPFDDKTPIPDINVLVRKAWPGALVDDLPKTTPSPIAMSYIIRNQRQRGKFNAAKAKELQVPKGQLWAQLSQGKNVQSEDGQIVTPDLVLGEGKEGGGVAIIDLPSTDYVQNLIDRQEWDSEGIMTGVGAVLWLLGTGVGQDPRLQTFMKNHAQWKHIVSSADFCPNYLAMSSSANSAIRLSQINRQIFPIPVHDNNAPLQQSGEFDQLLGFSEGQPGGESQVVKVLPAQRGLMCQLEPAFQIQNTAVISFLDTASTLQCMPKGVLTLAQTARTEIASELSRHTTGQDLPSEDAEIVTLGTGSALPSKYRNVSATLLRVPGCGSYLLDCGENTLGQLRRVYGEAALGEVLRDLKLIWISHLHADHHLGTVSIIKAWRDEVHGQPLNEGVSSPGRPHSPDLTAMADIANPVKVLEEEQRLVVTGTGQMMKWLKEYAGVEDFGYDKIVPLDNDALKNATGLSDMRACQVPHCYNAQAVVFNFPTGFKFSYSGDCRPSSDFAKIGKGSTVLLHEATFDDELRGDAEAKKHSTTSEAIGVGLAMGAKRVILTHFSQRYQKIPVMENLSIADVKLENADETEDSDVPMVEAGLGDPSGDASSGADVMQDVISVGVDLETELSGPTQGIDYSGKFETRHSDPPSSPKAGSETLLPSSTSSGSESGLVVQPSIANDMKICVAFDYMRIKVKEIEHMEKYTRALLELYQQDSAAEEIAKKAASNQQHANAGGKEKKRKDESDDESGKEEKKKSNEEINRGKSKRQARKERRENTQKDDTGKGQSEEKQNTGATDRDSVLLDGASKPERVLRDTPTLYHIAETNASQILVHQRGTSVMIPKHYTECARTMFIYRNIRLAIAYTAFRITGQVSSFRKVSGYRTCFRKHVIAILADELKERALGESRISAPLEKPKATLRAPIVGNSRPTNKEAAVCCWGTNPMYQCLKILETERRSETERRLETKRRQPASSDKMKQKQSAVRLKEAVPKGDLAAERAAAARDSLTFRCILPTLRIRRFDTDADNLPQVRAVSFLRIRKQNTDADNLSQVLAVSTLRRIRKYITNADNLPRTLERWTRIDMTTKPQNMSQGASMPDPDGQHLHAVEVQKPVATRMTTSPPDQTRGGSRTRRKPVTRVVQLTNWDLTLQSVAREIEDDVSYADHSLQHRGSREITVN